MVSSRSGCNRRSSSGRKRPDGRTIETDSDVVLYLLESVGVALVAGAAYGLSSYFRLSIATSQANLDEGIARTVAALD
jgi:aspartate aminotransferase